MEKCFILFIIIMMGQVFVDWLICCLWCGAGVQKACPIPGTFWGTERLAGRGPKAALRRSSRVGRRAGPGWLNRAEVWKVSFFGALRLLDPRSRPAQHYALRTVQLHASAVVLRDQRDHLHKTSSLDLTSPICLEPPRIFMSKMIMAMTLWSLLHIAVRTPPLHLFNNVLNGVQKMMPSLDLCEERQNQNLWILAKVKPDAYSIIQHNFMIGNK